MSVEAIPFPPGAVATSPQANFTYLTNLVAALRRLQSQLEQDDDSETGDLQEQINGLNTQIANAASQIALILDDLEDIENNGGLTAQQAFELSLVTAVDQTFGSVANLVRTNSIQLERDAEDMIRAAIAAHRSAERIEVNTTGIRVEQIIRQNSDEALASQITTVSSTLTAADEVLQDQITAANAAIVIEQTARSTADAAQASQITTVAASVTTEQDARIAADTDLQGQVTTLSASVTDEATARSTSDTAAAERITGVAANIDAASTSYAETAIRGAIAQHVSQASVFVEQQVRTTAVQALATQVTTFNASLGVTNANLTALETAVTTGDNALAASVSTVSTAVAGNTASITTLNSSVNGIYTRWGVQVNAQNEVIGFINLDGNNASSALTIGVDFFQIGKSGTTGGTAVPVFAINTVSGTPKITFRGDMHGDGLIIARMVGAAQITADKINVTSLSAIAADIGTVTAGLIRNTADTLRFDLPNMRIYRVDGAMDLDFKNKKFEIIF